MLPNFLSLLRILVIPPIIFLLYAEGDTARWAALGLYTLACLTDYLDGVLARGMNLSSRLGQFLDPVADKLLVATLLLMLVATGHVAGLHTLACLIILLREIMVSGLREFLAEIRIGMPVSRLAKWKTACQMFALGFLIMNDVQLSFPLPAGLIGLTLLWAAALLTLVTGLDYLRAGLRYMK